MPEAPGGGRRGVTRPARALAAAAAALAAAAVVAALLLAVAFRGNVTGFFRIGDVLPLSPRLAAQSLAIHPGQAGYDGQLFLTIALDPLLGDPRSVEALDNPRYRYRRILYPLAGHLLGGGSPRLIPWALVAVNLLCVAGIAAALALNLAAGGARDPGRGALVALAVPGMWIALTLATADLLGSCLFLCVLAALRFRRIGLAALGLALAGLARETYLPATALLALAAAARRDRRAALSLALALLPPLAWNGWVAVRLTGGTGGLRESFGPPLLGVGRKLLLMAGAPVNAGQLFESAAFLLLLGVALLLGLLLARERGADPFLLAAALPPLAYLAFARLQILGYHMDYLRVFADLSYLLIIAASGRGLPAARALLAASGLASLAFTANYLFS